MASRMAAGLRGDVAAAIQRNLIAYVRLFAGLPGITMHDAESFWFVSNRHAPGNIILRAAWTSEHVEERIDELLEQVGRHADHVDWMVFPNDRPADLGRRLEARGIPGGPGGYWLWADLATLGPGPIVPDQFRIE